MSTAKVSNTAWMPFHMPFASACLRWCGLDRSNRGPDFQQLVAGFQPSFWLQAHNLIEFVQVPVVWKRKLGVFFTSMWFFHVFSCIFRSRRMLTSTDQYVAGGESTNEFLVFHFFCHRETQYDTVHLRRVGPSAKGGPLRTTDLPACLPAQNPPTCYKSGNLDGDENC